VYVVNNNFTITLSVPISKEPTYAAATAQTVVVGQKVI
jgi:hypothetical protein